ncbi:hypothetical protein IC617_08880 [Neiella sp. HB171785]|uniref:Uncharacterized protein n=1 Tax=Neiella litorisoli TaxID=2771431 RepID=A0A8J6QQP3_9GAMM|nr:hypothetical protein [Neiella litorisoli]MBD1389541.1 hypothetical protein [Neiella litorisoli]
MMPYHHRLITHNTIVKGVAGFFLILGIIGTWLYLVNYTHYGTHSWTVLAPWAVVATLAGLRVVINRKGEFLSKQLDWYGLRIGRRSQVRLTTPVIELTSMSRQKELGWQIGYKSPWFIESVAPDDHHNHCQRLALLLDYPVQLPCERVTEVALQPPMLNQ